MHLLCLFNIEFFWKNYDLFYGLLTNLVGPQFILLCFLLHMVWWFEKNNINMIYFYYTAAPGPDSTRDWQLVNQLPLEQNTDLRPLTSMPAQQHSTDLALFGCIYTSK